MVVDLLQLAEQEIAAPILVFDRGQERKGLRTHAELLGENRQGFRHAQLDDRCQPAHDEEFCLGPPLVTTTGASCQTPLPCCTQ